MDYKKVGLQVLELVGGTKNLNKPTHYAARLRFELNNKSKVEMKKLENLPAVISMEVIYKTSIQIKII
ncbi:PTS transporter subunit EIIB [Clostridium botulinum]|uniref:PTS transporter subunit EIIB n=1 Tax=Clostridium botulinum TaxID=1491 RepID=UPI0002E7CD62|nr:PTS transporter subunit EIIB [Clostridium botulinum]